MISTTAQKIILRTIGGIGLAIFATFFSFTYAVPDWVETFGAEFIESEASKRIDVTIDSLQPPKGSGALTKLAESLFTLNEDRINQLKASLKSEVHVQMADAIAEIRNLDCECRDKWKKHFEEGFTFELELLQASNDKVVDFIHSEYMEVVTKLKRDIRIFTGSNAIVFLLLLVLSFAKSKAITHLFLPGLLLTLSTVICAYFYIFEQNWLLTIIYSNYVGFMYLGYLAMVFSLFCDILFNRGRVTTTILNAFLDAIGSVVVLVPC